MFDLKLYSSSVIEIELASCVGYIGYTSANIITKKEEKEREMKRERKKRKKARERGREKKRGRKMGKGKGKEKEKKNVLC